MRRAVAGLSWASASYLLLRVSAFYLGIGNARRHHIESAAFLFVLLLLPLALTQRGASEDVSRAEISGRRSGPALQIAGWIAASLLVYWPLLSTGLFADDYVIIDAVREGRFTVWRELFRPIIFIVWRPIVAATGLPAPLLHGLNIILHGINAALIALVARRLFSDRWTAAAAGGIFLLLPSGLEAVAWPSGLQDVLMTTFVLVFLVLVSGQRLAWFTAILALVPLIAGLLTKETAIAAPLLAGILGGCGETSDVRRRIWKTAAVSLGVVAGFVAIRLALLPLPSSYGAELTGYGVKELLVRPFATLVVPLREEETRRAPVLAIGLVTLVVISLRVASGRWHRQAVRLRIALAGATMVLAAVAPVLSYFYVDPDLLGSRYLYLAQAGWVLILVAALGTATDGRRGVFFTVVGGLLAVWSVAGTMHMQLWREAAHARDRIVAAAGSPTPACSSWAIYGLPATLHGVPLFVNGFPQAARQELPGRIRVAPAAPEPGECRLTWNGERFVRE